MQIVLAENLGAPVLIAQAEQKRREVFAIMPVIG